MFKSLLQVYLLLQALCSWSEGHTRVARSFDGSRVARYAEYDPPIILPEKNEQTVKAGQDYKLTCEGSRGVNWRIPAQGKISTSFRLYHKIECRFFLGF